MQERPVCILQRMRAKGSFRPLGIHRKPGGGEQQDDERDATPDQEPGTPAGDAADGREKRYAYDRSDRRSRDR